MRGWNQVPAIGGVGHRDLPTGISPIIGEGFAPKRQLKFGVSYFFN